MNPVHTDFQAFRQNTGVNWCQSGSHGVKWMWEPKPANTWLRELQGQKERACLADHHHKLTIADIADRASGAPTTPSSQPACLCTCLDPPSTPLPIIRGRACLPGGCAPSVGVCMSAGAHWEAGPTHHHRHADASHAAARLLPTSPRSVEACLRMGIDPDTLRYRAFEHFLRCNRDPALARLEYEHEEAMRQVGMCM
jgi:hypothetical protein